MHRSQAQAVARINAHLGLLVGETMLDDVDELGEMGEDRTPDHDSDLLDDLDAGVAGLGGQSKVAFQLERKRGQCWEESRTQPTCHDFLDWQTALRKGKSVGTPSADATTAKALTMSKRQK